MSYNDTTYSAFRTLLASCLNDEAKKFWTDNELKLYTLETLRTFNSIAQYSRSRNNITSIADIAFYNIYTDLAGSLLSLTITDQNLIDIICSHLIESVNSSYTWTGTEQFNITLLTNSIEKARDEFLLKTGIVLTHSTENVPSPPADGRVVLEDNIIDIRRVAFNTIDEDNNEITIPLNREDESNANGYLTSWNIDASTPESYSVFLNPKVGIQLIPIPLNNGTLDLITINSGATLNPTTGIALGIPNDFAWIVKFGALKNILSSLGQGNYSYLVEYCNQRFEEGILIVKQSSFIQQCSINGQTILPDTIENFDSYNQFWQDTTGTPSELAICGYNLIALSPVPDDVYSINLDVVRNIEIPINDGDFIQVGKEYLNTLLDYAVHLASIKLGGVEFQNTLSLKNNFIQTCILHRQMLNTENSNLMRILGYSLNTEKEVPRFEERV